MNDDDRRDLLEWLQSEVRLLGEEADGYLHLAADTNDAAWREEFLRKRRDALSLARRITEWAADRLRW